jgi:hypothetical protein
MSVFYWNIGILLLILKAVFFFLNFQRCVRVLGAVGVANVGIYYCTL